MSCAFTAFAAAMSAIRGVIQPVMRVEDAHIQVLMQPVIAALRETYNVGTVYTVVVQHFGEDSSGYEEINEEVLGLFRSEQHAECAMGDYWAADPQFTCRLDPNDDVYDFAFTSKRGEARRWVQVVARDLF